MTNFANVKSPAMVERRGGNFLVSVFYHGMCCVSLESHLVIRFCRLQVAIRGFFLHWFCQTLLNFCDEVECVVKCFCHMAKAKLLDQ